MPLSFAQRPRTLDAEILDRLPADHPDARSSRRDLRVLNGALGNWRWFGMRVPSLIRSGERVLEIGAGTGELGNRMARLGLAWDGLDLAPRPAGWPETAQWHQADVFQFPYWAEYPIVTGNLVFHHFDAAQLAQIGAALSQHARVILVGDLRRGRLQLCLFWALARLIGANPVTRHDGALSVRAGFRGQELPRLLQLDPKRWTWRVEWSQIAAYRLVAERRP